MRYNEDEISGFKIDDQGNRINFYCNNRKVTPDDSVMLQTGLEDVYKTFYIDKSKAGLPLSMIEKQQDKLQVKIPEVIKNLYQYFGKSHTFLTNRMKMGDFLPLDKLYVTEGKLVYKKSGNYLWGFDLKKGRLNGFDEEWYWDKDDFSLPQDILISLYQNRISHMKNVLYSTLEGFHSRYAHKKARITFNEELQPVENFPHNENVLFLGYNQPILAWFKADGFNSSIILGADDYSYVDAFIRKYGLQSEFIYKDGEAVSNELTQDDSG